MKKYILSILAVASVVFTGCNKEMATADKTVSRIVTVSADLGATKVGTGSAVGKFAWEAGDVIGIWTGSEFTPFTLDAASVGQAAATFTGTLPEGGSINESSIAVYPYDMANTREGDIVTVNELIGNVPLLAQPTATTSGSTTVASYKFALVTGLLRVSIKNIPAEAKFVYIETDVTKMFAPGGAIDLSAEYPKLAGEGNDWNFIELPEHSGAIDYELYVPLRTGEFSNPMFRFTLFTDADWGAEMDKATYSHRSNLDTGGYINRGDLFVLPEVTF